MNRRTICRILAGVPMVLAMAAAGQSPAVLHVAWVSPERAGSSSPNLPAFRAGMLDLGYIERKNLVIDTWWGEGCSERLEQMAGDIVRARPDVIVTGSGLAVSPMMRAGIKLPIVFVFSADPVEAKVVASFARPGGNMTGMSLFSLDLMGKRLEFLKEAMPGLKRIAIIANPEHSGEPLELKAAQEAATRLGLSYRYFPVRGESEVEQALAAIADGRDQAILA